MFKFLVLFNLCLWRPFVVASPGLLREFLQQVRRVAVWTGIASPQGADPVIRRPAEPHEGGGNLHSHQLFFALTHAPTLRRC